MLRISLRSNFLAIRRSSCILLQSSQNNNNTTSSSSGEDNAFPENADWLGDDNSSSSLAKTSSSSTSPPAVDSFGNPTSVTAFGSKPSQVEIQDHSAAVPVGIRLTSTESLMAYTEKKNAESFQNVKSDVAMRTQRALSAQTRKNEHFLLADLDPDLDTVLFGTDPEEFDRNVKRMKVIVSTYTKWERWDKFYLYGTRLIQFLCAVFLFLWWESAQEKFLLQTASEDYASQHAHLIKHIDDTRNHAIEYLIQDLKQENPPKILPPQQNASSKFSSLASSFSFQTTSENGDVVVRHPMDTRPNEVFEREKDQFLLERSALRNSAVSDAEFIKRARRTMLPMSDDWTAVVKEEIADYQKESLDNMRFPRSALD